MTIQEITTDLENQGYQPFYNSIDAHICYDHGEDYQGFKKGESYRAFSINRETNEAMEF